MNDDDDNSMHKNHPVLLLAKAKAWVKLFLFPVIIAWIICALLVSRYRYNWNDVMIILLLSLGAITGVWFATHMGKKHGLIEIDTRHLESRDIDEWLKKQKKQDE